MSGFRVTQRSIASTVLSGLNTNMARLEKTQQQLSSGKLVSKASDAPGAAAAAMSFRSDLSTLNQYARNADDGVGWLDTADSSLQAVYSYVSKARDLASQGMTSGSYGSPEAREALANEVDQIRQAVIGLANTTYLDRPIFGGTTNKQIAFNQDGSYAGDSGSVERTVSANTKVRVDADAEDVFGTGTSQLFTVLNAISSSLRGGDTTALSADISRLDGANKQVLSGLSTTGARYNQVSQMRQAATDRSLAITSQLSNVEDIDLPKTITDMALQDTAYKAALAATAKVIQPSLIDFLR